MLGCVASRCSTIRHQLLLGLLELRTLSRPSRPLLIQCTREVAACFVHGPIDTLFVLYSYTRKTLSARFFRLFPTFLPIAMWRLFMRSNSEPTSSLIIGHAQGGKNVAFSVRRCEAIPAAPFDTFGFVLLFGASCLIESISWKFLMSSTGRSLLH